MNEEKLYKTGDLVPKAGRYQCVVCWFVIEYLEWHLAYWVKFPICPVCMAWTENWPKKPDEDFWKFVW